MITFRPPNQARFGVSLIETVVCVAIVAAMSTSMVSMMRGSARMSSAANGAAGATSSARQTLRTITDQFKQWDQDPAQTITRVNGSTVITSGSSGGTYRFDVRRSVTGVGSDLVLINPDKSETMLLLRDCEKLALQPLPDAATIQGVEIRLLTRLRGDAALNVRPNEQSADIRTQVCFPPQLTAR